MKTLMAFWLLMIAALVICAVFIAIGVYWWAIPALLEIDHPGATALAWGIGLFWPIAVVNQVLVDSGKKRRF